MLLEASGGERRGVRRDDLVADPEVTVEVDGTRFRARATVVHGAERRRLYDAQAALMPGFAEYEMRTERVIPVVRLERLA